MSELLKIVFGALSDLDPASYSELHPVSVLMPLPIPQPVLSLSLSSSPTHSKLPIIPSFPYFPRNTPLSPMLPEGPLLISHLALTPFPSIFCTFVFFYSFLLAQENRGHFSLVHPLGTGPENLLTSYTMNSLSQQLFHLLFQCIHSTNIL